jgi:medium-chain acyl-[acyl-carrier-protein] hydrolase
MGKSQGYTTMSLSCRPAIATVDLRPRPAIHSRKKWIREDQLRPDATQRLFCFPYAGGGASVFEAWPGHLEDEMDVVAVQLPGRESRTGEAPYTDLLEAVKATAQAILPFLDRPFAFFGHGMGGLLSYELAHELQRSGKIPFHLFISACGVPHLPRKSRLHHALPRPQLLKELRHLTGTESELFESSEYLDLLLSSFRSDLQMLDDYEYRQRPLLSCPITALYGTDDKLADKRDMQEWSRYSSGSFGLCVIPGDHFFLKSSEDILLELLSRRIRA